MDCGMKILIQEFYRAVQDDGPVPIPYRVILTTARIMDQIFAQIPARSAGKVEAGAVSVEI